MIRGWDRVCVVPGSRENKVVIRCKFCKSEKSFYETTIERLCKRDQEVKCGECQDRIRSLRALRGSGSRRMNLDERETLRIQRKLNTDPDDVTDVFNRIING